MEMFNPNLKIDLNKVAHEDSFCKIFPLKNNVRSVNCCCVASNMCKNLNHYSNLTMLEIKKPRHALQIQKLAQLKKLRKLEFCLLITNSSQNEQLPVFEHLTHLNFDCAVTGNDFELKNVVRFCFPKLTIIELHKIYGSVCIFLGPEDIPNCTTIVTSTDYISMFNACHGIKYLYLSKSFQVISSTKIQLFRS